MAKISHKAGVKTAETAALVGSCASLVRNVVAMCKGEVGADEALMNVAKDTAQSAAVGYATGFAGSALKGTMQNSKSEYIRALSKTNLAGTVVSVAVGASKTISRYLN